VARKLSLDSMIKASWTGRRQEGNWGNDQIELPAPWQTITYPNRFWQAGSTRRGIGTERLSIIAFFCHQPVRFWTPSPPLTTAERASFSFPHDSASLPTEKKAKGSRKIIKSCSEASSSKLPAAQSLSFRSTRWIRCLGASLFFCPQAARLRTEMQKCFWPVPVKLWPAAKHPSRTSNNQKAFPHPA